MMIRLRCGRAGVAIAIVASSAISAMAAGPVSPYKALGLPNAVHPTLQTEPVLSITAGSLRIELEVTTLDAVKRQFGGTIRGTGDAGDAATWLCYAGA
jgi:hypothetical protein